MRPERETGLGDGSKVQVGLIGQLLSGRRGGSRQELRVERKKKTGQTSNARWRGLARAAASGRGYGAEVAAIIGAPQGGGV